MGQKFKGRVTVRGRGRRAIKHRHEDRWVFAGSTARTLGAALHALAHRLERGQTELEKQATVAKLVMSSLYGKFASSPAPTPFKADAVAYYDSSSPYPASMLDEVGTAPETAMQIFRRNQGYRPGYLSEVHVDRSGAVHVEVSSNYPASLLEGSP